MEQYFAKQLSNCCKLNFSNHVIKSQKALLSPKNSPQKIVRTINKSQKKSLKRVQSDQALTMTKKTNTKDNLKQSNDTKQQKIENILNQYGSPKNQTPKYEAAHSRPIQKVFSAQNLFNPPTRNQEIKIFFTDSDKKLFAKPQINYGCNEKKLPTKKPQINHHFPVSMVQIERNENLSERVFFIGQNPQPMQFKQAPNILTSRYFTQNQYQINNFSKNTIQKPFVKEKFKESSDQKKNIKHYTTLQIQQIIKNRGNNFSQSEYFSKIYGEVDLQEQIKKDLIKSLDFNKTEAQTESFSNGMSVLIRNPSSDQSTIIPLESKLTKKGDWKDSFNYDKNYHTQKILKFQKPQNSASSKIRIDRRQKFKSIVSVDSQHQSSQAVDSIIIEQHPKHLLSSKPLKSLL